MKDIEPIILPLPLPVFDFVDFICGEYETPEGKKPSHTYKYQSYTFISKL